MFREHTCLCDVQLEKKLRFKVRIREGTARRWEEVSARHRFS